MRKTILKTVGACALTAGLAIGGTVAVLRGQAPPVHDHEVLHFSCETCSRIMGSFVAQIHSGLETGS